MGQESLLSSLHLRNQVSPFFPSNEIVFHPTTTTTAASSTVAETTSIGAENSCSYFNERHKSHVSPISLIERLLLVSFTSGLLSATVAVVSINRTIFMTFYPTGSLLMSTVFALGNRRNFCKRITLISLITFVATSLAMMTLGFTETGISRHSWHSTLLTIGLSIQIVVTMIHATITIHS